MVFSVARDGHPSVASLTAGAGRFSMKVSPPVGGIYSGMPNAPGLLSFMVAHSTTGAGRFILIFQKKS